MPQSAWMSLGTVVCFHLEASITSRFLVQRSPTDCICVCVCVLLIANRRNNKPLQLQWAGRRCWSEKERKLFLYHLIVYSTFCKVILPLVFFPATCTPTPMLFYYVYEYTREKHGQCLLFKPRNRVTVISMLAVRIGDWYQRYFPFMKQLHGI